MTRRASCKACGTEVPEEGGEVRTPCPKCGSTLRAFAISVGGGVLRFDGNVTDEDRLLKRFGEGEGPLQERKPTENADEIRKTVVAFANSVRSPSTGVLYLGVNEDGSPSRRITNPDKTQRKVMDYLQECYPPIPDIRVYLLSLNGSPVVAVEVPESRSAPHFTGAAYVRVGSASRQASASAFDEMIADRTEPARLLRPWRGQTVHVERQYEPVKGRIAWEWSPTEFRLEQVDAVGLTLSPPGGGPLVRSDWKRAVLQPLAPGQPPLIRISLG